MKAKMKWLAIALSVCLIASGILVVVSLLDTSTMPSENSGIQASLVTAKDTYAEGEAIDATLSIGNLSGADVANLKTSITSPRTLSAEKGSVNMTYEKLGAAQMLRQEVTIILGEVKSNVNVLFIVALVVMIASAAGLVIMLITGKFRINRTSCLLLLVGVMLFSLIPNVHAAKIDEKKVEVTKDITVADQQVTLTATITWEDPAAPVITRADMEAAINEILWDYYLKDVWVQYDSTSLDKLSTLYGGFGRLDNHLSTLENANSDDNLYSVCSNYPWVSYYEAIGFPLFGYCMNAQSKNIWGYASTTVKNEQVNDMVVARWHGWGGDYTTTWHDGVHGGFIEAGREDGYLFHDKCFDTFDELKAFIANWEENLRPGDIIHLPGHIVVYAGNGYILQSGGAKFNAEYNYDQLEKNGSISAQTVEECFFPGSAYGTSYYRLDRYMEDVIDGEQVYNANKESTTQIAIVRPLNILTIPDGDNDPGNDVLDVDFVYNGVDKLVWQFEFDKVPLAHSGYTIQPSAYTRMQYPGMNIDRTVNITPYGTATKGEEITYTIAIYNESNNAKYVDNKRIGGDENYTGVNYIGLPITETLPANVELVEAKGATIIGDTMYWNVDIAAGECVKVSYTVKVTGEIGDEIVCGGGWVGSIPSNTIVNTIGGQKLSAESVANLIEFCEVGQEVWNSNEDGYKISAALENTEFAERIYNATTGLDLDIPDAQTLLDILFTQEHIYVPGGMYGVSGSPAESWMYMLKDTTADADDQIWRDMIIDGFFGGTWVWSNRLDPDVRRTDDLRVDYMEPGDIIVNMTLSSRTGTSEEDCTVNAWQVLVYLGDEYFASLNSDGIMACERGPQNLLPSLSYDVFVALRPSQVYENINEDIPAFTGSVADLTDADKAWTNTSAPSEILLNDVLCGKLAALTPSDISDSDYSPVMIGDVYNLLNIDVVTKGTQNMKSKALMSRLFSDIPSDSEAFAMFGHESHLLNYPQKGYEGIYNMLMNYDGRAFVDGKPLTSLDQLHVGDAILLIQRDAVITITMIYQGVNENGNHQFLTGVYSATGKLNYGKHIRTLEFADVDAFNTFAYGHIPTRDFTGETEFYWEGYLVLRPSRAYDDINAREVRDISTGALSDSEKQLLISVTPEDLIGTSGAINLDGFAQAVYSHAFVQIDKHINVTVARARQALFFANSLTPKDSEYYIEGFQDMLVENAWGGTYATGFPERIKLLLTADDFQIGDILGIRAGADNKRYIVAIWQGDKFLTYDSTASPVFTTYTLEQICAIDDGLWHSYFVLRPENASNAN